MFLPIGWVIQAIKNDGSVWYIKVGHSGPYELEITPHVYITKDSVQRARSRLVTNFGFSGSPPYPYDIECFQTAELFIDSKI